MKIPHDAFILHVRPYRESSSLLEIFTREAGRLSLVAKGVRKPKSVMRSLVQPFIPLLVTFGGKGELQTLYHAESRDIPFFLKGKSLISGFYLNELLIYLLPKHDAHPQIFSLYEETCRWLSATKDTEYLLRRFEMRLLQELGYAPMLHVTADTQAPVESDKQYLYLPARGVLEASSDLHDARHLIPGNALLHFVQDRLETPEDFRVAKRIMRMAIQSLLGEKTIKSRELFLQG